MSGFERLLSPVIVRRTTVRNRVVITAHGATELFRNPTLSAEPYIEYLRQRAAGGVGLIIAQPQYPNPFGEYDEETLDRHGRLAQAVKAEGATLLIQLAHLGLYGRTDSDPRRQPLWGFDSGQSDMGEANHQMTDAEVEQMVDAYRRTAAMAAAAGFDGVEVHGAHGYLIQQSLTPRWNHRADRWAHDRTLFARMIIEAARTVLGPEAIIGYRTATDDFRSTDDGGRTPAGIAADLKLILGTGEVDLLNTTVGDGGKSYARAIPSYRSGEAPNISFITKLRTLIDIEVPVIGVGRITSPGAAQAVLESGACDLVAMTRAHIADPELVRKTAAGNGARIRPCVGASVCVDRKLAGFADISCFHNPQVLREHELTLTAAAHPKRVLVVGAGPAGLKAAEIAAHRGHHVVLYDARSQTGGALRLTEHTAAAPLAAAIDYLTAELAFADVEVHLGVAVDETVLRAERPDEVIVATGARPRTGADAFDGGETGAVISSAQVLASDVTGNVLVYDGIGGPEAALVAEALAKRGARVSFATRFETVMPYGGQMHRWVVPDILHRRMERIYLEALVGYIDKDVALLVRADGETIAEVGASTIVAVVPGIPDLALIDAVTALGVPYRVVGDALAPRTAWQAFTEGMVAATRL